MSKFLKLVSGVPRSATINFTDISGTALVSQGGTNLTTYTTGDMLYASATNVLSKLPIGTTNQLLSVVGGIPAWVTNGATSAPTVQTFTSGSGTYTTPAGVIYIRVRMVGAGGGGGGGGTNNGGSGGTGTTTTFGSSFLTATGGIGGAGTTQSKGGGGGSGTIGVGAVGTVASGGSGGPNAEGAVSLDFHSTGSGGSSFFGGGGSGGAAATSADPGSAWGSGGGGGSGPNTSNGIPGAGGGAGGFVDAIVSGPSSTYSYSIGTGGSAGAAGSSGFVGGSGASGYIEVIEYYANGAAGNGGAFSPTIQKFTSSSGTYTTPAGVLFIKVKMVGGGGGGSGSGTSAGGNGGTGGNTTFGTSLLVANGASGGTWNGSGGAGGSASLGSGPIGTALTGGTGQGADATNLAGGQVTYSGAMGAASPFGGAGAGSTYNAAGTAAISNTGSGGGGGGSNLTSGVVTGTGGGAGGYIDALITSPSATYSYSVGTAGTAGTAGGSGLAGGAGGSGYIEVTEYYSNGAIGTATNVTGIVAIANGGTGQTNLGTSAVKFIATNNSVISISNTQITGWTAVKDTSGILHTGGDYVIIPTTGYYWVAALVTLDIPASQPLLDIWTYIKVDSGSGFVELARSGTITSNVTYSASSNIGSEITRLCYFNANDHVAIFVQQDTGGAKNTTANAIYNHWSIAGMI